MKKNAVVTLKELERDAEHLRKKLFIYETLQSEKEIRAGRVKGPFKTGAGLVKSAKT